MCHYTLEKQRREKIDVIEEEKTIPESSLNRWNGKRCQREMKCFKLMESQTSCFRDSVTSADRQREKFFFECDAELRTEQNGAQQEDNNSLRSFSATHSRSLIKSFAYFHNRKFFT